MSMKFVMVASDVWNVRELLVKERIDLTCCCQFNRDFRWVNYMNIKNFWSMDKSST